MRQREAADIYPGNEVHIDKKKVILIVAVIAVVLIGYLIYSQLNQTASGHLSVNEAESQAASIIGQKVAIAGTVVPGSISWDGNAGITTFSMSDSKDTLVVYYPDYLPNSFKPEQDIAVEGFFHDDGRFEIAKFRSNAICSVCH